MGDARNEIRDILDRVDSIDVLDILLIALIIYGVFLLLRGTPAMALLRGGGVILVVIVLLARSLNLEVLDFLIRNSLTGLIIAVPIIFQPEIRRALERIGRTGLRGWAHAGFSDLVDTVVSSAMDLAVQRHGALIVFERETGLQAYVESGVGMDAEPSRELLGGIFYPNSPLSGEMGLRHRAGLGVTEGTDAVSLMVSEESGMVAVAADGRLYSRLDETRLRGLLERLLDVATRDSAAAERS